MLLLHPPLIPSLRLAGAQPGIGEHTDVVPGLIWPNHFNKNRKRPIRCDEQLHPAIADLCCLDHAHRNALPQKEAEHSTGVWM